MYLYVSQDINYNFKLIALLEKSANHISRIKRKTQELYKRRKNL